jgi:hypothetical protein
MICIYRLFHSEIDYLKQFGLGQMHIYTFLLRRIDIMTSYNTGLSSWDILYNTTSCKIHNAYDCQMWGKKVLRMLSISLEVMLYTMLEVCGSFGRMCSFHLQGWRVIQACKHSAQSANVLLKCQYICIKLNGNTPQKISTMYACMYYTEKTSNLGDNLFFTRCITAHWLV